MRTPNSPLPSDPPSERALISRVVNEGRNALREALDAGVTSAHFHSNGTWGQIFAAAVELEATGSGWDPTDLESACHRRDQTIALEISPLQVFNPGIHPTSHYIQKVCQLEVTRRFISELKDGAANLASGCITLEEFKENHWERIQKLATEAPGAFSKRAKPFTVWKPSEFLAYDASNEAPLVGEGVLAQTKVSALIGVGGIGKSRLVLDLACALATGRSWCGVPVHTSGVKTLILCTENSPSRWQTDLERIRANARPEDSSAIEECVRIVPMLPSAMEDMQLTPVGVARLVETLKGDDYRLVAIDPWGDFSTAENENDNTQVLRAMQAFRRALDLGAPLAAGLIVHHGRTTREAQTQAGDTFTSGNFARGAKTLPSKCRSVFGLSPDEEGVAVLWCDKVNDTPKFAPRGVRLNETSGLYELVEGWTESAWRERMAGKRTGGSVSVADVVELVRELQAHPGAMVQTKDIVQAGVDSGAGSERTIKKRLKEAVQGGRLNQPRVGFYAIGKG